MTRFLISSVTLAIVAFTAHCENIKIYFNNCVADLYLNDYHNYTGKTITPPPDIKLFETGVFEYEYANRAEFHSYLDGNVNWRSKNQVSFNLVHLFFNVNSTGGLYVDVEDHHTLGASGCLDVPDNGGQLPTILGIYSWWLSNTTFDTCQQATTTINGCDYPFYVQ